MKTRKPDGITRALVRDYIGDHPKASDAVVASALGCHASAVSRHRRALDIPPLYARQRASVAARLARCAPCGSTYQVQPDRHGRCCPRCGVWLAVSSVEVSP